MRAGTASVPWNTLTSSQAHPMVDTRIKLHHEQLAENERRRAQRSAFVRNQTLGLLLIAALILAWWLFHTNPQWIFPPGWWRL